MRRSRSRRKRQIFDPPIALRPVPVSVLLQLHHLFQGLDSDLASYRVRGVTMSVQQGIRLVLATAEGPENTFRSQCRAQRDQAAGQQFGVHRDVGVDAEEGGSCEAAQAVDTCEDLVENDRKAGPGVRIVCCVQTVLKAVCCTLEQVRGTTDDID